MSPKDNILFFLPIVFGMYYFFSGIWPILHISSFLKITGPKKDLWLVKTVGAALSVIGLTIFVSGLRKNLFPEVFLLAGGACIAMCTIDIYYVLKKIISPIYLLDAFFEIIFLVLWIIVFFNIYLLK